MRDEPLKVRFQLADPSRETPIIRAYLDYCADTMNDDPQFQEKLRMAQDEFVAFGSTILSAHSQDLSRKEPPHA